jgi:hypothetical protein
MVAAGVSVRAAERVAWPGGGEGVAQGLESALVEGVGRALRVEVGVVLGDQVGEESALTLGLPVMERVCAGVLLTLTLAEMLGRLVGEAEAH